MGYGPQLPDTIVKSLESKAKAFLAPKFDKILQKTFWRHVYNENKGRLQVITGTPGNPPVPSALQITGVIKQVTHEADGDLHLAFVPDPAFSKFPINHNSGEPPLEAEIIYAGKVTQKDAVAAGKGFKNPFLAAALKPGTRIQIAGPLIYDRAHGKVASGNNIGYGLEIHPVVALKRL